MLGDSATPSRQLVWLLPLLVQTGESHQYIRGAATAVRPQTKASIGMGSTPSMHSRLLFLRATGDFCERRAQYKLAVRIPARVSEGCRCGRRWRRADRRDAVVAAID